LKKLHLLFPVLLSIACASSPDYERGAYAPRPPAPTFTPSQDAPHTTGQPGYVGGRRVERSPNRRHVTPSDHPQMMAADGDARRAVELMLSEDEPRDTPEGIPEALYEKCWKDLLRMMQADRDEMLRMSPEEVRCLRNRVLAHCGARQLSKLADRTGEKYDDTFEDFMAGAENRKACGKKHESWTGRVTDYINKYVRHGDDILGWQPSTPTRGN
jgi:hypothetical protein